MIKVKNLKCDLGGMWMWTIRNCEDDENGCEEDYFTNTAGEGIFTYTKNGNLKQITGTCQFWLTGYSISGARNKIKKWFEI